MKASLPMISYRLIHALRIHARIGKIVGMGREKAARVWRLNARQVASLSHRRLNNFNHMPILPDQKRDRISLRNVV